MILTHDLKQNSGMSWVLERLTPLSPFGRNAMKNLPWYGPDQADALETELDNVGRGTQLWRDNTVEFRGVTRCLPLYHDIHGSLDRDPHAPFDLVELFELKHFLLTTVQLVQAYEALGRPFEGLEFPDLTPALDLVDPTGRRLPAFVIENSYHPELEPLRREKRELEKQIRQAADQEKPALLEQRRELAVREDQLELIVRRDLTVRLMEYRAGMLDAMDALGHLDMLLCKSRLARRYGCVRPVLSARRSLHVTGLSHPQVAEQLTQRGDEFTPLDLTLENGCTVITGANMGGKTVSIRSVVLALLLCQSGFFVFAEEAELPLFEHVELILADAGPGSGGLSSFGTEVAALDRLLRGAKRKYFFVALDEFARGTNPQEGAALAKALVHYLGTLECMALMTTHYDGVSDVASAHYQVTGLVREVDDDPGDDPRRRIARRMDYRLQAAPPGAPCPRDAMRVCRLLDLEPELMELFSENS